MQWLTEYFSYMLPVEFSECVCFNISLQILFLNLIQFEVTCWPFFCFLYYFKDYEEEEKWPSPSPSMPSGSTNGKRVDRDEDL